MERKKGRKWINPISAASRKERAQRGEGKTPTHQNAPLKPYILGSSSKRRRKGGEKRGMPSPLWIPGRPVFTNIRLRVKGRKGGEKGKKNSCPR